MSEPDASKETITGAGSAHFGRLKRRAEFQHVARGQRWQTEAFVLQAAQRTEADGLGARVGFTATRKIGGAVERNRLRRRLKEALRRAEKLDARADHDYVVVARRAALSRPFELLRADLNRAFAAIHVRGSRASKDRDRAR